MPPKAKLPAPIDRPLSKAYLREFSGWSTAYPPGLSDPTSLRIMENVMVNRDGSVRVRPGLRYLSFDDAGLGVDKNCVGTHEPFFLNDGTKAYLFAVREADDTVGFRVLVDSVVKTLTASGVDFSVPQGEAVLAFTSATTYVKYLQIDNKIFALSNAGEPMRLFVVGTSKSARKLTSIERPNFDTGDKLTVVHPDAGWVNNTNPTATRTNLIPNPSVETSLTGWSAAAYSAISRVAGGAGGVPAAVAGAYVIRMESKPQRTNLMPTPLRAPATGLGGWVLGAASASVTLGITGGYARITLPPAAGSYGYANGPLMTAEAGKSYQAAIDVNTTSIGWWKVMFRFYNGAGTQVGSDVSSSLTNSSGRVTASSGAAPAGTALMRIFFYAEVHANTPTGVDFRNVLVSLSSEASGYFDGASGADYYWTGTVDDSPSVYHPAAEAYLSTDKLTIEGAKAQAASMSVRAGSTARQSILKMFFYASDGSYLGNVASALTDDSAAAWTRLEALSAAPPAYTTQAAVQLEVWAVPRGEYHYADAAMLEQAAAVSTYFDGDTADTGTLVYDWAGTAGSSPSTEKTYTAASTIPAAETPTVNTLLSSTTANNIYSFAYFYTISNEVGESAASQITVQRVQRRWTAWKWEGANASGEPNGTIVSNPNMAADQLVAYMPQAVYDEAKAQGATAWNLYMLTWSDQDSVPVEGILLGTKAITAAGTYGAEGWQRNTPALANTGYSAQLPTATNRYNYSKPSSAAQGIVASDRMILVDDPVSPAVIRWSSNQQGEYTNFTAAKGGGYKTLTSGNLYVPAAVKLWQNPQSVDTLTILCQGIDGQSAGYYMAPATISSQSEQTSVMGFEETTATPGTTSPYGCEVLNNALYHPLDTELMKSTASNYNINHKPMTDQIQHNWAKLQNKHRIVSAQHDNRLYYIVHNPDGEALQSGCMGNEVWVLDAAADGGTWSRWLIQASALRRIEQGGQIYLSVVRPDGIYYLDPYYDRDDVVDPATRVVGTDWISWKLETNTQGANRAHDAWCHLQQANISLGNFVGRCRWGIRTVDIHGRVLEPAKDTKDVTPPTDGLPWDYLDYLKVGADVMEWRLFAESIDGEQSVGQVDFVQYRYTPVSVNVGYEYGAPETFEYVRSQVQATDRTTMNGVPVPFADTARP